MGSSSFPGFCHVFFSVCFNKKARGVLSSSALQFFYFYTSNPSFLKHTKCASTNFLHLSSSAPNFPTHSSRRSFVSGHAQQIFFFAFFFVFLCRRLVLVLFQRIRLRRRRLRLPKHYFSFFLFPERR